MALYGGRYVSVVCMTYSTVNTVKRAHKIERYFCRLHRFSGFGVVFVNRLFFSILWPSIKPSIRGSNRVFVFFGGIDQSAAFDGDINWPNEPTLHEGSSDDLVKSRPNSLNPVARYGLRLYPKGSFHFDHPVILFSSLCGHNTRRHE